MHPLPRWSNDTLMSTPHRVCLPVTTAMGTVPARYSIAFFCNANKDTTIACLPTCTSASQPAKYAPVNALDYLVSRLQDTI